MNRTQCQSNLVFYSLCVSMLLQKFFGLRMVFVWFAKKIYVFTAYMVTNRVDAQAHTYAFTSSE